MDAGLPFLLATSLGQNWWQWLHPTPDRLVPELWGFPLLWWGRIGKCLQFVGGATLILDLIGPDNLRTFGRHIGQFRTRRDFENLRDVTVRVLRFLRAPDWPEIAVGMFFLAVFAIEVVVANPWFKTWVLGLPSFLPSVVGFLATAIGLLLMPFYIMALLFGFMLLMVGLQACWNGLLLLFDALFIEPIAWFLDHPRLEWRAKLFAFLALIIGFHFDLLAS